MVFIVAIVILTFTTPGGKYVYDRETNSLLSVTDEEFPAFQRVETGTASEDDWERLKRYTEQGYLKETCLEEIQHPLTPYMRHHLESQMSQLTMQVTQNCNLRCSYCAYGNNYENQRGHSNKVMSLDMMKKCVDFIMTRSYGVDQIAIGFYGGEPFIEIENIMACIDYIKEVYEGRSVAYTITTNGTIFDDETIRFLDENNFGVNISFDGPKELHDKNRVYSDGRGSFDKIMANVSYIKGKFPKFFKKVHFMSVVAPGIDFSCVNDFFTADKVLEDSFVMTNLVSGFSANDEIRYDDLYYVSNNYQQVKILLAAMGLCSQEKTSRLFASSLNTLKIMFSNLSKNGIVNKSHPSGPCLPGVTRPFVDVNGNIFPCERVSEGSEMMKIGHIDTKFDYNKIKAVLNVGKLTEAECITCWNYIHCGLCVAACDDDNTLSRDMRLKYCLSDKLGTAQSLRTICLLRENNYTF